MDSEYEFIALIAGAAVVVFAVLKYKAMVRQSDYERKQREELDR